MSASPISPRATPPSTASARLQAPPTGRLPLGPSRGGAAASGTTPLSLLFDAWAIRRAELRRLCRLVPADETAAATQEARAEALGAWLVALEARIARQTARDHRDLALKAAALTGYLAYHSSHDLEAEADALQGPDAG